MRIEMVGIPAVDAFAEHIDRLVRESGVDGRIISTPREPGSARPVAEVRDSIFRGLSRKLDETGWKRSWALYNGERPVGHADLHGGLLPSEMHRARLGMGIESAYHRRGHGRELLTTAIAWAREQGLSWIDLGVFSHNHPARRLYESQGFTETGRRVDAFRVSGQSIDDIQMSLSL